MLPNNQMYILIYCFHTLPHNGYIKYNIGWKYYTGLNLTGNRNNKTTRLYVYGCIVNYAAYEIERIHVFNHYGVDVKLCILVMENGITFIG